MICDLTARYIFLTFHDKDGCSLHTRFRQRIAMSPLPAFSASGVMAAAASGAEGFITSHGGDIDRISGRAGLAPGKLALPTDMLNLNAYCRLFTEAAKETQHGNLGLWFGQQFQPQTLGLIGFVALLSPTVKDAIHNLATHFIYHQSCTHTRLVQQGNLLRLEYAITDPTITERRQDAELTLGMFCNVLRYALGPAWQPEEVHFAHAQPEQAQEHREAFQADVRFGRPTNALIFRDIGLERAMPDAQPHTLEIVKASLISLARNGHSAPHPHVSFKEQVLLALKEILPEGGHLTLLAARMNMPVWTLQRRLADLGISYSDLVETTRYKQACVFLQQPEHDISQIARLLGYSETSAFSRAFRKWSGVSPRTWRQQYMPAPPFI
ncbi:AraC-like transcriptional regulator QhpR [Acetobacter pasteurianus]|uniref:AraC-like transcriptional regulator QhpR n=1 Tax=Acetobacter pasteurianus TaxID=438 RepID=UPI00157F9333|nr:AraC family transcriptional regulator [Acetobacter pasteurianus]